MASKVLLAAAHDHDFQRFLFRSGLRRSEVTRIYTPYQLQQYPLDAVLLTEKVAQGSFISEWEAQAEEYNTLLMRQTEVFPSEHKVA